MSRTNNSIKNIQYSVIGQIVALGSNFITRMVFVKVLSAEYLGVNGLFTNILSILSFAELGIGPAIVYSMYKPLADKNTKLLNGLMKLYKSAYVTIGTLILILGAILTPFLDFFIKDMPNIDNIEFIYVLFVINTAGSYFFSYKRSFLIADQKKYIDAIYHYSYFFIRSILQIFILLFTGNFIFYLIIQILITFAENFTVSLKVNKLYPFISSKREAFIDKSVKAEIKKNVKAMIFHKMGSVIVLGTDNLLISKFVGIVAVGIYSNYLLVITALRQIFNIIFQSMIASVGNLGATEDTEKKEFIFRSIDFIGFWLYGFASIALITLFNPFIELWLGKKYLFNFSSVLLIVVSFYLTGRRRSVLTFRDAFGLFWHDRYKPILESGINLAASIILVKWIGFEGVILGTIISTLTTNFWIEPYVLYKFGFDTSMTKYFRQYLITTSLIICIGVLNIWLTNFLGNTLLAFSGKILITMVVPNLIIMLIFWRTKELQHLLSIVKSRIKLS